MRNIEIKKYLISIAFYIVVIIILTSFFFFFFELHMSGISQEKSNNIQRAVTILLRNTQNFLQYIVLAPLMPLFYLLDCVFTSWSISLSIQENGPVYTIMKLMPHGIIEIPNFCLYTLISFTLFRKFYGKISIRQYVKEIVNYKWLLIFSGGLVFLAALIEGMIT